MEQIFSIAICDDEKSVLDIVENITKTVFAEKNIAAKIYKFSTAKDLLDTLETTRIDLILLDIELNEDDGIEIAKQIDAKGIDSKIVFISSHEERVFDSLKAHPYGFIRKSAFVKDFDFVINSYLNEDSKNNEIDYKLALLGKNTQGISVKNISYIESQGRYQIIHLANPKEEISVRLSMNELSDELKDHLFLRIHKSYLVNSSYIQVINSDNVQLITGETLYVSKRNIPEIKNAYIQALKKKKKTIVINNV